MDKYEYAKIIIVDGEKGGLLFESTYLDAIKCIIEFYNGTNVKVHIPTSPPPYTCIAIKTETYNQRWIVVSEILRQGWEPFAAQHRDGTPENGNRTILHVRLLRPEE